MTTGPEIVNIPQGERIVMTPIHVTFATSETAYNIVNGVTVPERPDHGYDPDAFVLLREAEADDDTSN